MNVHVDWLTEGVKKAYSPLSAATVLMNVITAIDVEAPTVEELRDGGFSTDTLIDYYEHMVAIRGILDNLLGDSA